MLGFDFNSRLLSYMHGHFLNKPAAIYCDIVMSLDINDSYEWSYSPPIHHQYNFLNTFQINKKKASTSQKKKPLPAIKTTTTVKTPQT